MERDTPMLIRRLEELCTSTILTRADRRFIEQCLPDLRKNILNSEDHAELERILTLNILSSAESSSNSNSGLELDKPTSLSALDIQHSNFGDHATLSGRDTFHTNQVAVGTNLGTIIFGEDFDEQRRIQLVRYLTRLANEKAILQLRGLARTITQGLTLPEVYVALAITDSQRVLRVLTESEAAASRHGRFTPYIDANTEISLPHEAIIGSGPTGEGQLALLRATLVSEVVAEKPHLIICGSPGGGKSTFLAHLAWVMAQRGLDIYNHETRLPGWSNIGQSVVLPIILPLRRLAGKIRKTGVSVATVSAAIREELETTYDVRHPDDLLDHALSHPETVLLLFDGLDEIPIEETSTSADRLTTLRTVRDFIQIHGNVRLVITCRQRAWTRLMASEVNWPMVTISPFTGGQIRHFIHAWYPHLVNKGMLTIDQSKSYADCLIDAIFDPNRSRLRIMAENPLMLTMMAQVQAEGELPRDRPALYDKILQQLLGQWDLQHNGQSLSQVIGDERITSDQIRNILDRLSYIAHCEAKSSDGRGRILTDDLRIALTKYFAMVGVNGAYEASERCISYFEQRSGLLQPENDGSVYVFAHLTLQEHCAGRHLLLHEKMDKILSFRGDDRWREAIFLGIGVLMHEALGTARIEQFLTALIASDEPDGTPKVLARWYRDLMLAAAIGEDRDWGLLRGAGIAVPRLQASLRQGLVHLLEDQANALQAENALNGSSIANTPPIDVIERSQAAVLLAALGDSRFPIQASEWKNTFRNFITTMTPEGEHYWRYVPGGEYQIGGWRNNDKFSTISLNPFWVARFPVTIGQYRVFIQKEGYINPSFWSDEGLKWLESRDYSLPSFWNEDTLNQDNYPVIGVNLYEAQAFCSWLNTLVEDPKIHIWIPTEIEWEVAVIATKTLKRPIYPWGNKEPTKERAIFRGYEGIPPVGICSLGKSAIGALDMGGTIWEWTTSQWDIYPNEEKMNFNRTHEPYMRISLRGGSYQNNSTDIRNDSRFLHVPISNTSNAQGFRCFLFIDSK